LSSIQRAIEDHPAASSCGIFARLPVIPPSAGPREVRFIANCTRFGWCARGTPVAVMVTNINSRFSGRAEAVMRKAVVAAVIWATFVSGALFAMVWPVVEPVAIAEGETCFRCARTITDSRIAGEMFDGTMPTKYKTAGCMARYVASHPGEDADLYVTDYATGALVDPVRALFVPVTIDETTNERDYRAYVNHDQARAAAQSLNVEPVDWKAVLERAKVQVGPTLETT
jgi:hypothetical protein